MAMNHIDWESGKTSNSYSFEIPILDFGRAVEFYQRVFETSHKKTILFGMDVALLANDAIPVNGILIDTKHGLIKFEKRSVIIQLSSKEILKRLLQNVELAGGFVNHKRHTQKNFRGSFQDLEGNVITFLA